MTHTRDAAPEPVVLWHPDEHPGSGRAMAEFVDWLAWQRGVDVDSYRELHEYSVTDLAGFW
ncbi:MAG: hypothetical protein ACRDPW_04165, partial [Mycobacteriales bacterium]